jgi:predicted anti-sigma-YlaC factor YlaD
MEEASSQSENLFNWGKIDCAETRRLASDYLENDLVPQKCSAFQGHLARCGPCRAFVDTLASTIGMLSRLPQVTPHPAFRQSIIERAKREEQGRQNR